MIKKQSNRFENNKNFLAYLKKVRENTKDYGCSCDLNAEDLDYIIERWSHIHIRNI